MAFSMATSCLSTVSLNTHSHVKKMVSAGFLEPCCVEDEEEDRDDLVVEEVDEAEVEDWVMRREKGFLSDFTAQENKLSALPSVSVREQNSLVTSARHSTEDGIIDRNSAASWHSCRDVRMRGSNSLERSRSWSSLVDGIVSKSNWRVNRRAIALRVLESWMLSVTSLRETHEESENGVWD